jgi:hypothetical protein
MAEVWDNCPRADWLLWIANKLGQSPDYRTLRLFAVWCAKSTPLPDGRKTSDLLTDPRSLAALEVAERYANGKASQEELVSARDAARDAAGAAARYAAWAAAWAAQADQLRTLVPNPFQKEAQSCQCTNGIIRSVGRDNEEIIEDCPCCSARKEAQP